MSHCLQCRREGTSRVALSCYFPQQLFSAVQETRQPIREAAWACGAETASGAQRLSAAESHRGAFGRKNSAPGGLWRNLPDFRPAVMPSTFSLRRQTKGEEHTGNGESVREPGFMPQRQEHGAGNRCSLVELASCRSRATTNSHAPLCAALVMTAHTVLDRFSDP